MEKREEEDRCEQFHFNLLLGRLSSSTVNAAEKKLNNLKSVDTTRSYQCVSELLLQEV